MRTGTVLRPSATTAVDPFVVDRVRLTAFALLAGASACPDPELLQPFWRASMPKHRTRKTALTTWVCTGMRLPFLTHISCGKRRTTSIDGTDCRNPDPTPLPEGEGREHRTSQDRLSGRELPYRPLRGLVGQFELWQGEILSNVLEHHLHTFANGDIRLSLRIELVIHQVGDQAYTFLRCGDTALLVQFDNNDWKGNNVAKAWLDRVHNDFIRIYCTLSTDLLPTPLEGLAPWTPG